MPTQQAILIIVTGAGEIAPGEPTGLWLEEFAVPYLAFTGQGFPVTVASIHGGAAPVDPRSAPAPQQQAQWQQAIAALRETVALRDIDSADYAAVFIPGGHGTMFDFPGSEELQRVLREFVEQDKVLAAVCHGPASLVGVKLGDGTPLVAGRTLTSFTDAEESAAGLSVKMPFLLESRLRELGANFVEQANWSDHVQVDGKLITGQNPQSSTSAAGALIDLLSTPQGA